MSDFAQRHGVANHFCTRNTHIHGFGINFWLSVSAFLAVPIALQTTLVHDQSLSLEYHLFFSAPDLATPFPQRSNVQSWDFMIASSPSVRSCRPFGLLENTRDVFSDLQTNLTLLNDVIWCTCDPPPGLQDSTNAPVPCPPSPLPSNPPVPLTSLPPTFTLQALHAVSLTFFTGYLIAVANTTTPTCSSACMKAVMGLYVDMNGAQLSGLAGYMGPPIFFASSIVILAPPPLYRNLSTALNQASSSEVDNRIRRATSRE
ncbi:hypothetical protein BDP27DRAFT_1428638 [Rhodocollybia butyracea]|uniref:Uncharacterized protein n=1 Tax=Rhodocollybia butyracea TaxID=206335 RepID=A0A9P5U0V3_9AGAR|nr:hypothetical protein BDP27DRAFT_1428638 [Rhodocollybia butyracea]